VVVLLRCWLQNISVVWVGGCKGFCLAAAFLWAGTDRVTRSPLCISLRRTKIRVTRRLSLALLAVPSLCIAQPNRFRRRGTPLVRGLWCITVLGQGV
jgi:hypothetical protein